MSDNENFFVDTPIDYPFPDPDWDYATVYEVLWRAKGDLENLMQYIAKKETANKGINSAIQGQLTWLKGRMEYALELMNK